MLSKESLAASALTLLAFISGALLESRFVTVQQFEKFQQRYESMHDQLLAFGGDIRLLSQKLEQLHRDVTMSDKTN